MGAMSRRKGAAGELEAAKAIAELFRVETRRGQQFSGGKDSPDIVTSIADVHFEVKRAEKLNLWPAVDQAISDAGGKVPVVLHRPSRRPWVAVVRLEDLPRLAVQLYLTLAANPTFATEGD